jgi:hypothetical protein
MGNALNLALCLKSSSVTRKGSTTNNSPSVLGAGSEFCHEGVKPFLAPRLTVAPTTLCSLIVHPSLPKSTAVPHLSARRIQAPLPFQGTRRVRNSVQAGFDAERLWVFLFHDPIAQMHLFASCSTYLDPVVVVILLMRLRHVFLTSIQQTSTHNKKYDARTGKNFAFKLDIVQACAGLY